VLGVLLADEHLVAVDKPAGRLVIPGRAAPEATVQQDAEALFGRLWVVHRLDRGTSGVLLFARSAEAHRALNLAFENHRVAKRYLALVRGAPAVSAVVTAPIAPARRGRMRAVAAGDPRGKEAATELRLLEAFAARPPWPPLALVEALPRTGRTHQIRIHLAFAGTPLAVDPDYGDPGPLRDAAGAVVLARTPLHAASLDLLHPATGLPLHLEAPLPADLVAAVAAARGGER
jgi:tRNA pseudouridine32 synthase/23S rRNA pseudouridine746 synthase